MANKDNDSKPKKELDSAFKLIEEGHEHKKKLDHWAASRSYSEAASILETLHHQQEKQTAEGIKIAKLYHDKAVQYLQLARLSLVAALQHDTETDTIPSTVLLEAESSKNEAAPGLSDISELLKSLKDEDCQKRLELFGRLFAKEETNVSVQEATSQLENRLLQLSSSIPRSLKSETERIRDLNRGLRRLGLATVDTEKTTVGFDPLSLAPVKNESDQVHDIINQAKDEVKFAQELASQDDTAENAVPEAGFPDEDDVDEGSVDSTDEDDDVDDVDLTADTCRSIHEQLLSVEVSLAELIALFEVDDGGDAEIEFDQQRGRHLLRNAMGNLNRVKKKWESVA